MPVSGCFWLWVSMLWALFLSVVSVYLCLKWVFFEGYFLSFCRIRCVGSVTPLMNVNINQLSSSALTFSSPSCWLLLLFRKPINFSEFLAAAFLRSSRIVWRLSSAFCCFSRKCCYIRNVKCYKRNILHFTNIRGRVLLFLRNQGAASTHPPWNRTGRVIVRK